MASEKADEQLSLSHENLMILFKTSINEVIKVSLNDCL